MRRLSVGAVAIAATLVFTSCASSYDDATRDGLRQYVVTVSEAEAISILETWLTTSFEGGRHQRRIDLIDA